MGEQEQRIVVVFDEAGAQAKLEKLNRAFEQQEKVVEKDAQALGQLSLEFDKATKAANSRQMDLFNKSLATTSTTAKQLGFDFKTVATEAAKLAGPSTSFFDSIVKGGNAAKAGLVSVNEAILSFTRSYGAATAGLAAGVYAATRAFDSLFTALDRGQTLNDLERSFTAIKEGTGATQVSLQGLQQATFGLLDSTTLLTQANTAMTLGLPGDELEDLYQKTIQLARAQGVDAVRAIESITIGIARQSKLYLDNLGIIIDIEKAQKRYAAANNTTTEALSDQQKQAAFYQATQEALNEKVKQTADVMLTAAERSQQFRVRLTDLVTEFGQGITQSTALGEAFAGIGTSLDKISFEQIGKSAGDMAAVFVNSVLPPLTRTATLLEFINNFKLSLPKLPNVDVGITDYIIPGSGKVASGIQEGIDTVTGWMANYNKSIADAREASAKEFQLLQNVITEGFDSLSLHPATGASPIAAMEQLDEKTRKALESFKKLNSDADLNNLKQQIDNAIGGKDENIFGRLVPQLEAEFKKVRTDELTRQLKDGIDKGLIAAEEIAKTVNAEWSVTANDLQSKMAKALDNTASKGAEAAGKIRKEFEKVYKPSGDPFGTSGIFKALEMGQQEAERINSEIASDQEQKLIEAQKEAYRDSVDFFGEILSGVIEGDIEDVLVGMLKRAAIQFGAEMLAQMTGNFSLQALMKGGMNFGVPGTPPPGTPPPGTPPGAPPGAAASPWASAGYVAGAYVGYEQYRGVKGIAEGQDVGDMDVTTRAALAFLTFGFSELFNAVGLGSLGDFGIKSTGKSREQQQRDSYRDALFEQGIISDPDEIGKGGRKAEFALFGGGYGSLSPGSEFRGVNQGAEGYVGLGNVLSSAANGGAIDADLSAMFANALAEADSFNAAVLTTRGLLEDMGVTAEEAGFAMVDAYYRGEIGLDELNAGVNTLIEVAKNDLPSLADGVDLFTESLDDPKSQIPALGLLFQEMAQNGIDSADEMKAFFAENFAPAVAESLSSIVDAGIDTMDEVTNLTLGQTQLVINELDAAAKTQEGYTESVIRHGEESEKAAEKSARGLQKERQEVEKNARAYEDARRAKQRYFSEGSTQDFGPQAPG